MSSVRRMMGGFAETGAAYAHLVRAELGPRRRAVGRAGPERRFLLLANWLPPDRIMGGTYRPTSFLEHAAASGWRATALTRELVEEPDRAARELAAHVPSDCLVIRVPPAPYHASRRVFPEIDGTVEMALQLFDGGRRGIRADPSVVVATGPHFHNFLAAFYLARHFRSKLVLDYRDEWTECPFAFVRSGRWDTFFERRILRRADAVVFTTRSQMAHAVERFPVLSPERCFLVPNGWDALEQPDGAPIDAGPVRDGSSIVISFVGNLAVHTHPGAFLDMLEGLVRVRPELSDQLRLRLVGRTDEAALKRLARFPHPQMIEQVGLVPLREAKREMASADALILFASADLARYLPGKLFEYLAARRPIMVYGEPGEASELVTSLGAGRRIGGEEDFLRFLEELDGFAPALAGAEVESWLAEHRRDVLAARFFEVLELVTTGRALAARTPAPRPAAPRAGSA